MINKSLKATVREDIGSNTTKKVRKEFLIPGVVYRKGEGTRSITVDALEFNKLFKQVGTSAILDLEVEGEVIPAIVKSVQRDPVKGQIIHIDLQKLDMQQRIKLKFQYHCFIEIKSYYNRLYLCRCWIRWRLSVFQGIFLNQ
jgi:large subunit ribosomal protein L25